MTPNDERAQIRAEAVRECVDVLRLLAPDEDGSAKSFHGRFWLIKSITALEALLPKPDPAKELVEEYRLTFTISGTTDCMDDEMEFARWLIDTGRLKP